MNSISKKPTVILLHGISRTSRIMQKLERALTTAGYQPVNIDYPSTEHTIEDLTKWVHDIVKPYANNGTPLHFVGHSMGGIIIRTLIRDYRPNNLGRVVMLGTPNHGSIVADFMQRFNFYKKWFGPAGDQIGTNHNGMHHALPGADYECGIISGDRSTDPWFSWFLYGRKPNDGKVSVENSKLEGMTDHVVVHVSHTFLPSSKKVIGLVRKFLDMGCF